MNKRYRKLPVGAVRWRKRSILDTLFIKLVDGNCRYAGVAQAKHHFLQLVLGYDKWTHYLKMFTLEVSLKVLNRGVATFMLDSDDSTHWTNMQDIQYTVMWWQILFWKFFCTALWSLIPSRRTSQSLLIRCIGLEQTWKKSEGQLASRGLSEK